VNPVENIKTIGKTKQNKTTKEVNAEAIKNHWENQKQTNKKQYFWTYDPLRRHRSKSFVFVVWVFPMVFDGFGIDLFGCFGFFGFPNGF